MIPAANILPCLLKNFKEVEVALAGSQRAYVKSSERQTAPPLFSHLENDQVFNPKNERTHLVEEERTRDRSSLFQPANQSLNPSESVNWPLVSTLYERKASLYMKHNIF